jgi:hypothetical protein
MESGRRESSMDFAGRDWKMMLEVRPEREFSLNPPFDPSTCGPLLTRMFECDELPRVPPGIVPVEPESTEWVFECEL